MDGAMTDPVKMFSWEPGARKPTSQPIATAEEVAKRAAELLRRYQEMDGEFPGLSLVPEAKHWGSLAIAVAPIGWALIHNSEDYLTQHCTRGSDSDGGPSIPVHFDDRTLIPRNSFIPEKLALEGVRHFIERGALAPNLPWTDRCD
jgi:hypothetical protein